MKLIIMLECQYFAGFAISSLYKRSMKTANYVLKNFLAAKGRRTHSNKQPPHLEASNIFNKSNFE